MWINTTSSFSSWGFQSILLSFGWLPLVVNYPNNFWCEIRNEANGVHTQQGLSACTSASNAEQTPAFMLLQCRFYTEMALLEEYQHFISTSATILFCFNKNQLSFFLKKQKKTDWKLRNSSQTFWELSYLLLQTRPCSLPKLDFSFCGL